MTTGTAIPTTETGPSAASAAASRLDRFTRSILWAVVTFLGVWTLLYQVALGLGLDSRLTLTAAVLVWGALAWWTCTRGPCADGRVRLRTPRASRPSRRAAGFVVIATVALWAVAAYVDRGLALAVGLALLAIVLVRTLRATPSTADQSDHSSGGPAERPSAGFWPLAWLLAMGSAALGTLYARPDGDDAYFLNLTTWVSERHSFPTRDTMISQEVFPAIDGHSPPVHSIEGLIGTLAGVAQVPAGTLTYLVVGPLMTTIAVLALAALVRQAQIPTPEIALTTAVVVLWLSGTGASYGTFFALRSWQGKSILLIVILPLILYYGLRLLDRPGAAALTAYGGAVVASIGASNSAVFLTPLLLAALTGVALLLGRHRSSVLLGAPVLYPLAIGVLVLALAPGAPSTQDLVDAGLTPPSGDVLDPLMAIPSVGGALWMFVIALGLGWAGVRSLHSRAVLLALTLIAGVMVLPPVSAILGETLGIAAVAWRFWWIIPVPLLVAGVVGAVADRSPDAPLAARRLLAVAGAAAIVAPMLLWGNWVAHPDNGARRVSSTSWKVPGGALAGAVLARDVSEPGDTVLAPWDVSRVLAGLTVSVQPVTARAYYLPSYARTPEAQVAHRAALQMFADEATPEAGSLDQALEILDVDTACVATARGAAIEFLREAGFAPVASTPNLTCLRRI